MLKKSLSLEDIKNIIKNLPDLKSINYGTGESFLNKDFEAIVKYVAGLGIKQALTTNGTSLKAIDHLIPLFDDIDISIDFPNAKMHDKRRGIPGLFKQAIQGIKSCKKHKVNVSIVSVLMQNNYTYFKKFKALLDKYDIMFRINLYKAVNTNKYVLDYDAFWDSMKMIGSTFKIISCSEPVLALISDDVKKGSLCGNSIRIHPDGDISSCVYIKDNNSIETFNKQKNQIPTFCVKCAYKDRCRGGCFGRRISDGRKELPDMYCPFYNNKPLPDFTFISQSHQGHLIHSDYLCTLILR